MIEALGDPYSSYLTSEDYHDTPPGHQRRVRGHRRGDRDAGRRRRRRAARRSAPDCRLVIVAPLAGSPAAKAGLRTGDLVLAVDGVALDGLTVDGARERIRGPEGHDRRR